MTELAARLRDELRTRIAAEPVVVSRVASPELRRLLEGRGPVVEAPAVAGRTVWAAVPGPIACVEQPTWWGCLDGVPEDRPVIVFDHRAEESIASWQDRTRLAAAARKRLTQLKGVVPAVPTVEAPWFVVLQPQPPGAVMARLPEEARPCVTAAGHWAELPGGVRATVPPGAGSEWLERVVASLAEAISGAAGR